MEQEFYFNKKLSGKIALVTGGTKGAGKAISERLLKAGATVIITANDRTEKWSYHSYCIHSGKITFI